MKQLAAALLFVLSAAVAAAAAPTSFTDDVRGHGPAVILIPGLSSPGSVWDATIDHLQAHYECHRLTLAGFAGAKPVAGPLLPTVRTELAAYIREKKLDHPIIIGHSLGGFLALWLASSEPGLTGPVISVDGLPAAAALMMPGMTPDQVAQQMAGMEQMIAGETPEQFAAQTKGSLAAMITKPEDVDRVAADSVKSDPATAGRAMREMLTTDIRADLKNIKVPVLLIGAEGGAPEASRKMIADGYETQVASIPDHKVVMAPNAKHFIMIDDPAFFFTTIDGFLAQAHVAEHSDVRRSSRESMVQPQKAEVAR